MTDDKWAPSVPNGPADLTIPIILHLNNEVIEVLPIESKSQSITHEKYIKNNATYLNKVFTIKLNNITLTQDIINAIKIVKIDGNVDISSNFQITLNSGNIDVKLAKTSNLTFDSKNNYLISIPCADTTIYRVFEIQDIGEIYNITYNLDGGQANNPDTYTSDHLSLTLNAPTKAGYEFVGWYLNSDLTTPFDANNLPYSDLTLYAKYQLQSPVITSKSNDISIKYNGKDTLLSLIATHPLTEDGYMIKYQWYYAQTLSSSFEAIDGATADTLAVRDINQSGYYACDISLVDVSNNVLSCISHNDSQTHIKVEITKVDLNININDILSHTELSIDQLNSKFSCDIECEYLPENVIEYQEILDYLQLQFVLIDTTNPHVKTISATIKDFDIYNVYIKSGQYRIVIDKLSSNNIYTVSDQGFAKDCVFSVADYGLDNSTIQLLKNNHLNYVDSYDISYSYLDTSATIYIPLNNKNLLTNLAVYMLKDNKLVKLDSTKTAQGISFVTDEADATYIIVQVKPNKLSNLDFLILIVVVMILGTFTIYIIITKSRR